MGSVYSISPQIRYAPEEAPYTDQAQKWKARFPLTPSAPALKKAAGSRRLWSKPGRKEVLLSRSLPQTFSLKNYFRRLDFRSTERLPEGFSAIRSITTRGRSGNRATR